MKTYTSEAVYLLTTLVNIARARSCDSDEGESRFINTIVLEIFEVGGYGNRGIESYYFSLPCIFSSALMWWSMHERLTSRLEVTYWAA